MATEPLFSGPHPFEGRRRVAVPDGHQVLLLIDKVATKALPPGRRDFWSGDIPPAVGKRRLEYVLVDARVRGWNVSLGKYATSDGALVDVWIALSARLIEGVDWCFKWGEADLAVYEPSADLAAAFGPVAASLVGACSYADLRSAGNDVERWASYCPMTSGIVTATGVVTVQYGIDQHFESLIGARNTAELTSQVRQAERQEKWRDDEAVVQLARMLEVPAGLLHQESKEQVMELMKMRMEEERQRRELPVTFLQTLLGASPFALAELREFSKSDPSFIPSLLGEATSPPALTQTIGLPPGLNIVSDSDSGRPAPPIGTDLIPVEVNDIDD